MKEYIKPYLDVETFELILNNIYSGIILCDKEAKIIYINNVYADLLGVNKKDALGKSIKYYFPSSRLDKVIESGVMELGQSCSLNSEIPLMVNRIPVKKDNEVIGAILQTVFKDFNSLKELTQKIRNLKTYKDSLTTALSPRYSFDSIIGQSQAIKKVTKQAKKYAMTNSPILILGATGTGKELFAHAIHDFSSRKESPFVCINCAGFPKELLESELFGYQPGAFTGASRKGKMGKIELANHGSLFLDEIGDLSLSAQGKILRVLETKQLDKIGGTAPISLDFRLIAATNKDLRKLIDKGDFREDLFYRLNAMILQVPSLMDRIEDVPVLVEHFLRDMNRSQITLKAQALDAMKSYSWPGNIRELKNTIEHVVSLADTDVVNFENLPTYITSRGESEINAKGFTEEVSGKKDMSLQKKMAMVEKKVLATTLEKTHGNMTRTAKLLEISRSSLYEKCQRHGLL